MLASYPADNKPLSEAIQKGKMEIEVIKKRISTKKDSLTDTILKNYAEDISKPVLAFKSSNTLRGHSSKIYALDWCKTAPYIASASNDGKVIIWNASTANKIAAIPLKSSWIMTVALSPSGKLVASGGLDNTCTVCEVNINTKVDPSLAHTSRKELSSHAGFLSCCQFVDEKSILTGSSDRSIILRDIENDKALVSFLDHEDDVLSLHAKPELNILVSGSTDTTAKVWDIRTGKCVRCFKDHNEDVNAVKFFPDGNAIISGDDAGIMCLFDLRYDGMLNQYNRYGNPSDGVVSLDFSKSGRLLFVSYEDESCIIWDTLKAEPISTLNGHTSRVSCLSVSPDGYAVASASWDRSIKIWTLL